VGFIGLIELIKKGFSLTDKKKLYIMITEKLNI